MSDSPFGASEREALAAVLDAIVPPSADGRLPGAGELGLADAVAERFGGLLAAIADGLRALDAVARGRGAERFAALAPPDRADALRAHAESDPGFLPGLIFQTYAVYYEHGRVLEALGLEPRPPHPLGYPLEQPDLEPLLEGVRRGPRRWREA